jgi:hypothetical protein
MEMDGEIAKNLPKNYDSWLKFVCNSKNDKLVEAKNNISSKSLLTNQAKAEISRNLRAKPQILHVSEIRH